VGPFVVREKPLQRSPRYDGDYTLVLHEIDGLFTINGHSFPSTLDDPDSLISLETGDRVLVRMINAGQQHHPMHMHGHQFKVVSFDGNRLDSPYYANTIDIAPGQTVDVEVIGNNPGTWTFHCHILPHVTNRGQYPGGMLTLVDYTDHTSYLEGGPAAEQPVLQAAPTTTTTPPAPIEVDREIEVVATDFAFDPPDLELTPGETVRLILDNQGVLPHNIEIPEVSAFVEAEAGATAETVFVVPPSGAYSFWCSIAGHREAGMEGTLVAR
jgi:FtsP/CotA-like multicopper oxidase with cupredoxin domain